MKTITTETVPAWAIDTTSRNRYTIAAAFKLADLEGKRFRMTADNQRAVFGFAIFGKASIRVTAEGVTASRSVCYGTDFASVELTWAEVERYAAKKVKPIW